MNHETHILKKSFREEKKKVMDNLSKLLMKTSQKAQECEIQTPFKLKIYHSDFYVERDTAEEDLYDTWDDLMKAQDRGEGKINIEKWNEIVEATKKTMQPTKTCIKCKQEKLITDFYFNPKMKDGVHSWCKECQKKYKKQWNTAHKKERLEYNKLYVAENFEAVKKYQKKYRENHKIK